MNIQICEPELIQRRGFSGFYTYFLSALVQYAGARPSNEPRPLPRVTQPRQHESAWIRCDGHWIFFDMSDHAQLFDIEALRLCSVYFKANLHRGLASKVLGKKGAGEHAEKLVPFLFFADGLGRFNLDYLTRSLLGRAKPKEDVCHVVGVYRNEVRDGGQSPFENPEIPIDPGNYHFWIRWHTQAALKKAGIQGTYRLTSRADSRLEDDITVHPNLSRLAFSRCMQDARLTIVNTLPHALLPWKATESFTLGRPILVERKPLTECPEPFRLSEGIHFLEMFPGAGEFDDLAGLDDPASYRVLYRFTPQQFELRAHWLREMLRDHDRLANMGEACRKLARISYAKPRVADYIRESVSRLIH